jgi:hypothetical protein
MKHISKIKRGKNEVKPTVVVTKKLDDGLDQEFRLANGKYTTIRKFLKPKDAWTTNGRVKRTLISHDGVKKIADAAGISKAPQYRVLTQPDAMNNYQYTIECKICFLKDGECAAEIGEANRSNLGSKGRGNPANMAEKRAYDRAVFRLLGITGLLSEEELQDEEPDDDKMDGLSKDESKAIAPTVNQLLLAKTKEEFAIFNKDMKEKAKEFQPNQLDYLRKLYKKLLANVQSSF